MGIYIFKWDVLRKALVEDHKEKDSEHDFGKNIIPKLMNGGKRLFPYYFNGYWKDVGTIDSYYEAQMEMITQEIGTMMFRDGSQIYSNSNLYPAHYIGKKAKVTEAIDNLNGGGRVDFNGQSWAAVSTADGRKIEKDALVVIRDIKGVKMIVEEL
jgi:ADP-glucose pyrophosphorylase